MLDPAPPAASRAQSAPPFRRGPDRAQVRHDPTASAQASPIWPSNFARRTLVDSRSVLVVLGGNALSRHLFGVDGELVAVPVHGLGRPPGAREVAPDYQ